MPVTGVPKTNAYHRQALAGTWARQVSAGLGKSRQVGTRNPEILGESRQMGTSNPGLLGKSRPVGTIGPEMLSKSRQPTKLKY